MKVMLIQDVDNLGLAGEVKDVADGYGRNYLIPQGLAVLATAGALKDADLHRRRATERRQRLADEMAALAAAVSQTTLVFQAKAGQKGRLYGSITAGDIADKLTETVGQEIDRRKLTLEGPIKQLGTHTVSLRLSPEAIADFAVVIESDEPIELDTEDESVSELPSDELSAEEEPTIEVASDELEPTEIEELTAEE